MTDCNVSCLPLYRLRVRVHHPFLSLVCSVNPQTCFCMFVGVRNMCISTCVCMCGGQKTTSDICYIFKAESLIGLTSLSSLNGLVSARDLLASTSPAVGLLVSAPRPASFTWIPGLLLVLQPLYQPSCLSSSHSWLYLCDFNVSVR